MYTQIIHKIVISFGFITAMVTLSWNLVQGQGLLYSAFISLCVLFASSTVLLIALQAIANILIRYLDEKKREQLRQQHEEDQKQLDTKH